MWHRTSVTKLAVLALAGALTGGCSKEEPAPPCETATCPAPPSGPTPDAAQPVPVPGPGPDAAVPTSSNDDAAPGDAAAPLTPDSGAPPTADAAAPVADAVARTLTTRSVGYARSSLGNFPALAARTDFSKLTHLDITFANPTATEPVALASSDADVALMVSAAHAAGVKVLVAIAGSSGTPKVVPLIAPDKVQAYTQAVVAFAETHGFDGVDVDIEDAAVNPAHYQAFIAALSAALKPKQKLLTAAVATWFDAQITDAAFAQMDFVSVMAYDKCGSWTDACEQATYDVAVQDLDHFVNARKLPASKVVLGVPFYGYCWGEACGMPAFTYAEILARFPGAEQKDWLEMPGLKLSYNGRATIERKAKLGRAHGGVMFWHLAADATGPQSLLDLVVSTL
jgi:chitinase